MIRGYQRIDLQEPRQAFQWKPALGAGLIAGLVFLVIPRGSPWSSLTFFSPVILGRALLFNSLPLILIWVLHLLLSIVYGLIIARAVAGLTQQRAILAGGAVGLVLYFVNLGLVSLAWPKLRGGEAGVVFTHVVFGLIAAGSYRGLLKRKRATITTAV